MKTSGPLLICARSFPPRLGGSAVLSRNLWGAWPADDIVVLTQDNTDAPSDSATALPDIPIHYVSPWLARLPAIRAFCEPLRMFAVRRELLRLAREVHPRAIWANWPSTGFLLGAWFAARALRLPLYVHMHDTWEESLTGFPVTLNRLAPRLFERRVLRSARRVFAITEAAADHFRTKYDVAVSVLKHCIPDADVSDAPAFGKHTVANVIHFAGSIYPLMNQDALVNLVKALALCQSGVTLEGFTFKPQGYNAVEISSPCVTWRNAAKSEVMATQRRSAILFLPLAFQSSNPLEIRTVFPTKLLEYLVSGRPILVHAPADSWTSRVARRDGWGEVVDQPDPQALARAIDALLTDQARQQALVNAAFNAANERRASRVVNGLAIMFKQMEHNNAS